MAIFCLIGGKSNLEIKNNKIEQHAFMLTNKAKPKVLFCPYAVDDHAKSNNKFIELTKNLDIELYCMTDKDYDNFDELMAWCDCLYIGGGKSDDLVNVFITKGYDKTLIKYLNTDKVYAGLSAGAMLYVRYAMGDKYAYYDNFVISNYKMVKCLGLLDLTICPHYQSEGLIVYNDEVKNYPYSGIALEDDTCVIIKDDCYYVLKENNKHSVYLFDKNNNFKMIPLYENNIYNQN
ncbi:MAG: Type 1 glutamine amidotransferase-like domain-containing protein [Acholeplasmatales bacterium]|nr:Type 1 glutamine amidotransferase-like domain-containing protein [Acholeplasmatales bacterium]